MQIARKLVYSSPLQSKCKLQLCKCQNNIQCTLFCKLTNRTRCRFRFIQTISVPLVFVLPKSVNCSTLTIKCSCSVLISWFSRLLSVQEPIGEALIGDFNLLKIKGYTKQHNQTRSSGGIFDYHKSKYN